MRLICLFSVVLMLHLSAIYADDEMLDTLKSMSGRIGNIEEALGGLIDAIGGLVHAVNKLEEVYECGWPKLANGHFEGNSSYYRGVLGAFCDDGYTLTGFSIVYCLADGIWSEMPNCIKDCEPPYVQYSDEVELDQSTYPYNSELSVECSYGYKRSGSVNMTCLGNNEWSNFIVCHPVDCGKPREVALSDDLHGTYGDTYLTTFNSTVSLTCEDGYERIGPDSIRCTGNRTWDGEQECLKRMCLDIDNGDGTNRTECMLEQLEAYSYGDIVGRARVYTDGAAGCIRYCFEHHGSFNLVCKYGSACICLNQSNKESEVIRHLHWDSYYRQDYN